MLNSTKKLLFEGCCTALITPFKNGEVDLDAFTRLVSEQIDAGISALVVCGTTGEAPTLTENERKKLIRRAVELSGGRVPIIAGTGGPCTDKMLRMSWEAREVGADALLIVNPYYNKGTEEGIVRSLYAAASLGPPVILYNVPARTGSDMSLRLIARLSEHDNIIGIKEATNVNKISEIVACESCDLHVYSGNDGDALPAYAVGGKGVISVISNVLPRLWVRLYSLVKDGKIEEACRIHTAAVPMIKKLFAEPNPVPVKALCGRLDMCTGDVRLPLSEADAALADGLLREYEKLLEAEKES